MKKLYLRIRIKVLVYYWRFKKWDAMFTGKRIVMPLFHWHMNGLKKYNMETPFELEAYKSKGVDSDRYFGSRRHIR